MTRTAHDEVVQFLSDMYSVEQQALVQMESAPQVVAQSDELTRSFRKHYTETQHQADRVRQRLEHLGGSVSGVKEAIMKAGGKGFLLFAKVQPESPGRLVTHAYSYEAMEWAGYQMLSRLADATGDETTKQLADSIAAEERTMMQRLEQGFDAAEEVSHSAQSSDDLQQQLRKHLAEAHALESQAIQLCRRSSQIAGAEEMQAIYDRIAERSRDHAEQLERRLSLMKSSSSTFKDGILKMAGLNWSFFFQSQSDTPAKLAGFVYAFLHLQIAAHQLLRRSAERVGNPEVQRMCIVILGDKKDDSQALLNAFDTAIKSTLHALQA